MLVLRRTITVEPQVLARQLHQRVHPLQLLRRLVWRPHAVEHLRQPVGHPLARRLQRVVHDVLKRAMYRKEPPWLPVSARQ
jgi:hypothetical protein